MAKEDFCFTYYDGDAARDMAHMNRLERGAYSDIIISQRKFGPLTLIQIKKILGKDFEECWGAIELVLKFEDDKYFIEWVFNSVEKSRKHSKRQKENVSNRYKVVLPKSDLVTPLEDGYGNENKPIVKEVIEIFKEKNPDYLEDFEKDAEPARKIFQLIAKSLKIEENIQKITTEDRKTVMRRWGDLSDFIVSTDFIQNYQLTQIYKNLQNILLQEKNGVSNLKITKTEHNAGTIKNTGNVFKGARFKPTGTGGY